MSRGFAMSAVQRERLWKHWHEGPTHRAIAEKVGISGPSVFLHLEKHGGIKPKPRKRKLGCLSINEREEISSEIVRGSSIRSIARSLERSPSTISREIERNGGTKKYRAEAAEKVFWHRCDGQNPADLRYMGD